MDIKLTGKESEQLRENLPVDGMNRSCYCQSPKGIFFLSLTAENF